MLLDFNICLIIRSALDIHIGFAFTASNNISQEQALQILDGNRKRTFSALPTNAVGTVSSGNGKRMEVSFKFYIPIKIELASEIWTKTLKMPAYFNHRQ